MLYPLLSPRHSGATILTALLLAFGAAAPVLAQSPTETGPAHSHLEVGIHGLAHAASNQGPATGTNYQFHSDGSSLRGGFGVYVDELVNSRHFAVHLGLGVVDRGGPYTARFLLRDETFRYPPSPPAYFTAQYDVRLRYLQVPLGFKITTGELLPRFRLYAEVGGSAAVLLGATVQGRATSPADGRRYRSEFLGFDAGVYAGLGGELRLTPLLSAVGSVHYYHGLLDILHGPPTTSQTYNPPYLTLDSDNRMTNQTLGVDFGVKFFPWRARRSAPAKSGEGEWRVIETSPR